MSNIEPKPPEIVQKIEWICKNWLKYWKHLVVAVIFLIGLWFVNQNCSEKQGENVSISSKNQMGGITAQTVVVGSPGTSDAKKEKIDIYSEIQSICEQLNDEYKQLIQAKIDSEFFNLTRLRSIGRGCIPLDDPPLRIKPIDQCWLSIDESRKNLVGKINKIEHAFKMNNDLKKEIIHLKVSKFNDNIASFQKARLTGTGDCKELRAWRAKAQKQGYEYLEEWFKDPYSRLLNELKKQL